MTPRLRKVDCRAPGIMRRRCGRGFVYVKPNGTRVTSKRELARIQALVIPPAWNDVWICTDPLGHIQAVGTDARGRRQYRYHPRWREDRDRQKFERIIEFARALPQMRERIDADLGGRGLGRDRVLACAVRLLDVAFFRIGGEGYAEENDSYGLATLLRRHTRVVGDTVVFDYQAKSGQRRVQRVTDPGVVKVVRALKRRRGGGRELLACQDGGEWCDVRSADINAYIKQISGGRFTAKDFRTWHGTVLAAVALGLADTDGSAVRRKRAVAQAMKEVSHHLGNTPAVARSAYVDPRVVEQCLDGGVTAEAIVRAIARGCDGDGPATHGAVERVVIRALRQAA